ncbi:hypothetical protein JCM3770_006763 [Rhodotorula araucariae]
MLSLDALSPGSLFPDLDDGDFLTIHLSRYSIQEGFSICHDGKRRLRCAFADLVVQDKNVPQPKNKRCTFFVAFKPAETVRRIVVSASNLKHNHRFELPPRLERVEKADIALRFAGDDDDPGILGYLAAVRGVTARGTEQSTPTRGKEPSAHHPTPKDDEPV